MIRTLLSSFLSVFLCLGGPVQASARDGFHPEKLAAIDAVIETAIAESKLVGATLWIEHEGEAYHKAYGQRALAPTPEPMTEDTLFDVASITKVVTVASAAMLVIERGLIGLDDPVARHLPAFTGDGREKITIRHLLLHTSGLKLQLNAKTQPFATREEAITLALREKPLFEPGSSYAYSSLGSMLLGVVIETATGRPLDEFCTNEIYRPLRMADSVFRPSADHLRRVAPTSAPQRGLVDDTMARLMGGVAGHASLFTTAPDLARFARMMLNLGELDGVRVFKPETIRRMTSVQSPQGLLFRDAGNLPVRRGLGWDIDTPYRTPPHDYTLMRGDLFPVGGYGHAGWTGQALWIDPFSRTFIVFLCNRYRGANDGEPPLATYRLHHRLATLTAEALKNFDFDQVSGALPKHAAQLPITKDNPLTNSLGMKFVPVSGTRILMCIHETRRSDYAAYAATNAGVDPSWKNVIHEGQAVGAGSDHPAVNVSWDDARAFCEWLGRKEGRLYRLPTDHEWSLAVGIGERETNTGSTPESLSAKIRDEYPWGQSWPPSKGSGNYADEDCKKLFPSEKTITGYSDGFAVTAPVMSFPPNKLGIHDLGGNVWEWCEDWFNAEKKQHIFRGGSWGSSAREPLLSSYRAPQTSDRRWRNDGFRCVLVHTP